MNLFTQTRKVPNHDLGELWQKFIDANNKPELKEWQRKVYVSGQHQSIGNKLAEHGEAILREKESNI